MAHAVKTKEGLSIEYDETTTCMVCQSPDAEDGNEIVFCDACNMCVHQHCYGVLDIPDGNWLCNPCSRGVLSPPCCLCPNQGGAMKRMKDSSEWIHVICAWWVPEVQIEDTQYIERINKDKIPSSRWSLTCEVCREKMGACIQCSVKRCVRAYHVTCAVKSGFEMKTVFMHDKDDVQHISFCSKHCDPSPPDGSHHLRRGLEAENNRLKELRKLESEFHKLVDISKAARALQISKESSRRLHAYWTMKRRMGECAPIIPLTMEQQEQLSGKQGVVFINQQRTLEMERFLMLRQDLERLRNLCYMIVRREKMRRELHRVSVDLFYKREEILIDNSAADDDVDFVYSTTDIMRFLRFSSYYRTESELEDELGFKLTSNDSAEEETLSLFDKIRLFARQDYVGPSKRSDFKGVVCRPHGERNVFEHLFAPMCKKGISSVSLGSVKPDPSTSPSERDFLTDDESDIDVEGDKRSSKNSQRVSSSDTKASPGPLLRGAAYLTSIADTIKFKLSSLRRRPGGDASDNVSAASKGTVLSKEAKAVFGSLRDPMITKDTSTAATDKSSKHILLACNGALGRGKKRTRLSDKVVAGERLRRARSCSVELGVADSVNVTINIGQLPVIFDRLANPVKKKLRLRSDVSDEEASNTRLTHRGKKRFRLRSDASDEEAADPRLVNPVRKKVRLRSDAPVEVTNSRSFQRTTRSRLSLG